MRLLSTTLKNLIVILSDGEFHDGTSIGKELNMTRSAVWKMIRKLSHYDVEIDSVKGKGYILRTPLNLFDQSYIQQSIQHKNVDIQIFETIYSTNDYLKRFYQSNGIKICLAESQTHGRGRFARQWFSPFGQNIYLSVLFPLHKDVSEIAGLGCVAGLTVTKTLFSHSDQSRLAIKWPNDVLYNNKKIAGILIDVQAEANGRCATIIGIGINVNMQKKNKSLKNWTSLIHIKEMMSDRNILCVQLINQLINDLNIFEKHGLNFFMEEWKSFDFLNGKKIQLNCLHKKIDGKAEGIDQHGRLLLRLADGSLQAFSSGEASLKKW